MSGRRYRRRSSDSSSSDSDSDSSDSCYDAIPVALASKPLAAQPRVDMGDTNPATQHFDKVTYAINETVPESTLRAQADGGKQLVLSHGMGIVDVKHSNVDHRRPEAYTEERGLDFVKSVTLRLKHNQNEPLLVNTNIRALATESMHVLDKSTIDKVNPNGLLGFMVPPSSKTQELRITRDLSEGQLKFVKTYAGITAEDLDKWAHELKNSDKVLVRASPESPVVHFYNALEGVKNTDKVITAAQADGEGYAYADKTIYPLALERTRTAMNNSIAYSPVKDPSKVRLTVSAQPQYVRDFDARSNTPIRAVKQQNLANQLANKYKSTPTYERHLEAARGLSATPEARAKLAAAEKAMSKETLLQLVGELEVEYMNVDPKFTYQQQQKQQKQQ